MNTLDEWELLIEVKEIREKRKEPKHVATCPICYLTYSVDNYNSAIVAEGESRRWILRHLKSSHTDKIKEA
jgi:hypothetical protein